MRISDWSSDVCSSDLPAEDFQRMIERSDEIGGRVDKRPVEVKYHCVDFLAPHRHSDARPGTATQGPIMRSAFRSGHSGASNGSCGLTIVVRRSEEHTSELQSLMRISYAVFFLKKQ